MWWQLRKSRSSWAEENTIAVPWTSLFCPLKRMARYNGVLFLVSSGKLAGIKTTAVSRHSLTSLQQRTEDLTGSLKRNMIINPKCGSQRSPKPSKL